MGTEQRCGGSSSPISTNKNKSKINSSSHLDKPKQPQRGLGVAQLEKIRLHTQMATYGFIPQQHPIFPTPFPTSPFQEDMRAQAAYHQAALQSATLFGYGSSSSSSSIYGYNHPNNFMMGIGGQMETASNIRFGESQPPITTRCNATYNIVATSDNQQFIQPQGMVTRHLLGHIEKNNGRDYLFNSKGSSSLILESSYEIEELDLELKL